MSRDIINDELSRLKNDPKSRELKRAINNVSDMDIEYNLKAYYDILNKSTTPQKKLEMLRELHLI